VNPQIQLGPDVNTWPEPLRNRYYERLRAKRFTDLKIEAVDLPSTRDHPKQAAFVNSESKRIVVRAGRRGGKTVGVAIRAVKRFITGRRILYAAPTQEQIDRFWVTVCRALQKPIDSGQIYKNETRHILEIPGTERRIRAKTAWNADMLRGDYADDLILDEWQLMNEDAWGVVGAPMLLDNDGDAIFIYTPPSLRSRSTSKAHDPQHAAKLFKKAVSDETGRWATFHFSSHDNPFISADAIADLASDMTAIAYRMEIGAEDIDEVPGALWTRDLIESTRVIKAPDFQRIVVAVDPSATSTGDEAGIITVGSQGQEGYVIADDSIQGSPKTWATSAVTAYHRHKADCIVAECVPLASEALTKNGWISPPKLQIGDEILGYDVASDTCKWTRVAALNFSRAEVVTYKHDNFEARCTRNHKWAMEIESRAGKAKYGKRLPYSKIVRGLFTIDEMRGSWRRANVVQVAGKSVEGDGMIISSQIDWMGRDDSVRQVLRMASNERRGFIYGMLMGEGSLGRVNRAVQFSQNPGAVNDAFRLACFLEGIPNSGVRIQRKNWKGEEKINYRTTLLKKRGVRSVEKLKESASAVEDVWCPTTEIGTWVMRQNERIIITGNSNNGGEMVSLTIATVDPNIRVKLVHASRGKQTRAEPVASIYEHGRGHHLGKYDRLEDEMVNWTPGDASPNRMDALVWGFTELGLIAGELKIFRL